MKLLILGYSDIAQRRIIPALQRLPDIRQIAVASLSRLPEDRMRNPALSFFSDYEQALDVFRPDLVHVSLANNAHAHWVQQALLAGAHVTVDKPAFTHLEDSRRLLALAARSQRCLAEATVYAWHPQITRIHQLFRQHGEPPCRLEANFSFPGLATDNFRYDPRLGGGALLDLGPYAVSAGRLFFATAPESLQVEVTARHPTTGVNTAFTVTATYPGNRHLYGQFSFDAPYANRLQLQSESLTIEVERIFTTPPELQNELRLQRPAQSSTLVLPAADSFACFFDAILKAIANRQYDRFATALRQDAEALDRLRHATVE